MRGERATLGKTLEDVEAELKIKKSYILAIENADPSVFAAPFVVAGYVRSYAKYLGLEPDESYRKFCKESGFSNPGAGIHKRSAAEKPGSGRAPLRGPRAPEFNPPLAPPRGSSIFSERFSFSAVGSICVLLALIGSIGYGGWTLLQEVQRVTLVPVNETPGVGGIVAALQKPEGSLPEYGGDTGGTVAADAASGETGGDGLDRLYRPQVLDVPFVQRRDGPIAAINPDSFGTLAVPVVGPVQETEAAPAPIVVETGPPVVEVVAANPAWVRIFVDDGDILFEKILDAKESFRIPEDVGFPLLRAGNSGSVYLVVDGATYGPVGSGTSVARRVDLTADSIFEMYPVAEIELTESHGAVENAEAVRQE